MKNKLYILGIGPGREKYINQLTKDILGDCDVIIGGRRNLEMFSNLNKELITVSNNLKEICLYIKANIISKKIVVVVSGDPGLYSLMTYLKANLKGITLEVEPGISALSYLCAKIHMTWNDLYITSCHGRENHNLLQIIKTNKKVAIFTGGDSSPDKICNMLCENNLENLNVWVGENLSYENERVISAKSNELKEMDFEALSIMIVENLKADSSIENKSSKSVLSIDDDEFFRGNVPMTKQEIRTVCVSKLMLSQESIVCDIGAGTGSVSIQCAIFCEKGRVYSFECNKEAISLIEKNKDKFKVKNLEIIEGVAPESIDSKILPDSVFIGGSRGNMESILKWVSQIPKNIRVVINTVTIESTYEAIEALKKYSFSEPEIVNIAISKNVNIGSKNLMKAANPVFVISADKFKRFEIAGEI